MNPLFETWLIVARELKKTLGSAKGMIMFTLSVLGATASTFPVPKIEEAMQEAKKVGPEQLHQFKVQLFSDLYMNDATGTRLADAPLKLVILFFIAVWLAPLLVVILGFDGIPSDVQHRSVRYWTIRSRRASYYVGKFLGLWVLVGMITFVMHALIWVIIVARGEATASDTLHWGLRFYAVSLPIIGAWCGIATLAASMFRTPMVALLTVCITFFLLFFAGVIVGRARHMEVMQWAYPNSFDAWMLSPEVTHALTGLAAVLGFALLTTAVGAFVFSVRDV